LLYYHQRPVFINDDNLAKARDDLQRLGITYDELLLVDSFDGKADVIAEKQVGVYFDDQPEM
jgi:hypothetical protein